MPALEVVSVAEVDAGAEVTGAEDGVADAEVLAELVKVTGVPLGPWQTLITVSTL